MKNRFLLTAFLFLYFFRYGVSYSQCTTLVLQPDSATGQDAPIYTHYASTNLGSDPELNAEAWTYQGTPGVGRSLINFDLSSIPSGATINSATLTLYNNPQSSNGLQNGQHSQLSGSDAAWLQRVTSTWAENTVTWNTQPTTTTVNEVYLPADTNPHQDYVLNVRSLVIDMINNPTTSFGFMLKLQTEQYYRCLLFASSDHPNAALHPKLEICYTMAQPCNLLVLHSDSAAGQDVGINSCVANNYCNTNMSGGYELNASAWTYQGNPGGDRSLLQFDLTRVPANASIQSATLTLYNNPQSSNGLQNGQHSQLSGPDDAWLQRITSSWSESTVTWNTQPTTTTLNEAYLPPDTNPNQNYIVDVTALVIDMINNPATSFGFMLREVTESYYRCLLFASSDHPNAALHPKLEICYTITTGSPVAHFSSSDTAFCSETGRCIDFFDHSTGNPTSWQWSFPGAATTSSTAQNPTGICYYNPGTYDVTLIVTNNNGTDTLHISPFIIYATAPPPPTISTSHDTLFASPGTYYQWYYNGFPISGATDPFYVPTQQGTYAVRVTDSFGCSSISNGLITSVNYLTTQSQIKIYPNPVTNQLTVGNLQLAKGATVAICDVLGQQVLSQQQGLDNRKPQINFDVSTLAKGVYFVCITLDDKMMYRVKFVKE